MASIELVTVSSMSLVQKLCDEIVDCKINTPSTVSSTVTDVGLVKPTRRPRQASASIQNGNGKVTRSVVIEKRKVINKMLPRDKVSNRRPIVNQFVSREKLCKKFEDIAINTLMTGPLRCDNDCVTSVRKRDNSKCSCRYSYNKRPASKQSIKETQVERKLDFPCMDKACTHSVETNSCGTQSQDLNDLITKYKSQKYEKVKSNPVTRELYRHNDSNLSYQKPVNFNYMGARRWALTKYPTRGPDF